MDKQDIKAIRDNIEEIGGNLSNLFSFSIQGKRYSEISLTLKMHARRQEYWQYMAMGEDLRVELDKLPPSIDNYTKQLLAVLGNIETIMKYLEKLIKNGNKLQDADEQGEPVYPGGQDSAGDKHIQGKQPEEGEYSEYPPEEEG